MNYKTEEINFSPFNADEVLKALLSVLRTSKHLSFSYAGDIQSLIDRIGRVFYAGRSLIFVSGKDDGKQVEIFEYLKSGKEAVAHEFASPFGQKMAAHLMTIGQEVVMIEEPAEFAEELDEPFRENFTRVFSGLGKEKVYLIPLRLLKHQGTAETERRAGLLVLQESDRAVGWNQLVVDSLVIIADHLAKLAQVESLSNRLEAHEQEDPATGLLNRRGGVVSISEEVERAKFFGDKLALLLIHVDTKNKREAQGTPAQSKMVLSVVSGVISSQMRPVDVVCRFGSEQFLLSLPRMPEGEAVSVAQHIKSGVSTALLNAGEKALPLTVSIGIAYMGEDGRNLDDLLSVCHELVSEAQSMGGNQIKTKKASQV